MQLFPICNNTVFNLIDINRLPLVYTVFCIQIHHPCTQAIYNDLVAVVSSGLPRDQIHLSGCVTMPRLSIFKYAHTDLPPHALSL